MIFLAYVQVIWVHMFYCWYGINQVAFFARNAQNNKQFDEEPAFNPLSRMR